MDRDKLNVILACTLLACLLMIITIYGIYVANSIIYEPSINQLVLRGINK